MPKHLDDLPLMVDPRVPPNTIYLMPSGSTSLDHSTGRTTELLPGVYVNPRTLVVIKNVK